MTKRRTITHKVMWRDILLIIREQADYLWPGQSHIEIHVARPKRAIIPITETGYQRRLHNFGRCDEWNLCLTARTVVRANQERE